MTYTKQPVSWAVIETTKKTVQPEEEEGTCDLLAVCDSLNKLCETLSRLEYVLQRKNIEKILTQKKQEE